MTFILSARAIRHATQEMPWRISDQPQSTPFLPASTPAPPFPTAIAVNRMSSRAGPVPIPASTLFEEATCMNTVPTNINNYLRQFAHQLEERILQQFPPLHQPGEPLPAELARLTVG